MDLVFENGEWRVLFYLSNDHDQKKESLSAHERGPAEQGGIYLIRVDLYKISAAYSLSRFTLACVCMLLQKEMPSDVAVGDKKHPELTRWSQASFRGIARLCLQNKQHMHMHNEEQSGE